MSGLTKALTSSIGKKVLTALTGLGLVGFLIGHVVGNQNMHRGAPAMDHYAEQLHVLWGFEYGSFLFIFVELGLLGMFLAHIVLVFSLIADNRAARGTQGYAVRASKRAGGASALASRTMTLSGITLLVFLVIHVAQIRLTRSQHAELGGVGKLVIDTLAAPHWALLYIAGALVVGWHIYHGIQSAARSFGLNHQKYTVLVTRIGAVLAIAIALGFASLPLGVLTGFLTEDGSALADLLGGRMAPVPAESPVATVE